MNSLKETTDIWFTAFLIIQGHKLAEYDVISRGKVKYKFNLSLDEWHKLKLEFNNSDLIKYKTIVEQIKDLGF